MADVRVIPAILSIVVLAACSSSTKSAAPAAQSPASTPNSSTPSTASTPSDSPTSISESPATPTDTSTDETTPGLSLPTDLIPTSLPGLGNGKGCEKLTPADVSAAAGFEVKAPQGQSAGPMVVCIFSSTAGNAVLVRLEKGVGLAGWTAGKKALESVGQTSAAVSGVGDEAYSAGVAGTFTVGARKGDGDVVVTLAGPGVTIDQAVAVAKLALVAAGL